MSALLSSGERQLRHHIYEHFASVGRAPSRFQLEEWAGSDTTHALQRLDEAHAIVLADDGSSIRMALPFSAAETGHAVRSGERSWWANCAWDSLAIPVAVGVDAAIDATWLDDDGPVDLAVNDGELSSYAGFVHFCIPARHWWDDIVET